MNRRSQTLRHEDDYDPLHRLRSASDTCWRRPDMDHAYFLLTTAQTTSWTTANYHSTTTASVLLPTNSSWSIAIVHVPKMGGFTYMVFTTLLPGTSLSRELSGGIWSLCLPIQAKVWSKLKQMVYNTGEWLQVNSDHHLLRYLKWPYYPSSSEARMLHEKQSMLSTLVYNSVPWTILRQH